MPAPNLRMRGLSIVCRKVQTYTKAGNLLSVPIRALSLFGTMVMGAQELKVLFTSNIARCFLYKAVEEGSGSIMSKPSHSLF